MLHVVKYRYLIFLLVFIVSCSTLKAQTNEQIWYEYMLNYPFANSFNLENAFTYSTLLGEPKWRSVEYNGTVEYSISPSFDILGAGLASYTLQTDNYNTWNCDPC